MGLVLLLCGAKRKYLLSPWMITIFVWTGCLLMYCMQNLLNTNLTWHFFTPFLVWIGLFCISSKFFFLSTPGQRLPINSFNSNSVSHRAIRILLCIVALGLPIYVYKYIGELIQNGITIDVIFGLRDNATNFEGDLGIFGVIPSLAKALLIVEMYIYNNKISKSLYFAVVANFIIALVLMEKGSILMMAIIIIYFLLKKRKISLKKVAVTGIILLAGLFIINVVRTGINENANIADFIALYVASPPVAFEYIEHETTSQFGAYSLRFFYAIASSFDDTIITVSNHMDPVYLPYPANVYTVLQPYYQDFGIIGVAFFACLIGAFMGFLYRKSLCSTNIVFQGLYAYYVVKMVNQYFQDGFFLSLSVAIQLSVILFFVSKSNVKTINYSSTLTI